MTDDERCYVCTERAHLMCPAMHFGILARIPAAYDAGRFRRSVDAVQAAHPFLQSLIARDEDGRLYYRRQEKLVIPVTEKADAASWRRDYDELASGGWDITRESMLKILCYPAQDGFQCLLTAHHMLCDGRGLLQLLEEFAARYVRGEAPAFVRERLIASLDDLPPKSALPLISRVVIDGANRRWDREKRRVNYEDYLAFERDYLRINPLRREIETIGGPELERVLRLCREHGVSVNDWLIARMMAEQGADKVVIAADIRRELACYRRGAMGNYATAFSVVVKKRGEELFSLARAVSVQVASVRGDPQKEMLVLACYLRMRPELLDAAAVSSLGDFGSASARFVGTKIFGYGARDGCCVTNLGKLSSDTIADAVFIPPASPANRATWGVLTVNGQMNICSVTSAK